MTNSEAAAARSGLCGLVAVAASILVMAFAADSARAELELVPGSFQAVASKSVVGQVDAMGETHYSADPANPDTRAGSHPFAFTVSFAFVSGPSSNPDDFGGIVAGGNPRNIDVDVPAGFVGNPNAVPKCPQNIFNSASEQYCPADTQVGIVLLDFGGGPQASGVYNIEPSAGEPARLGFVAATQIPVSLPVFVRSDGDYGISVRSRDLSAGLPLISLNLTLWGVPADPAHDVDRWDPNKFGPDAAGFGVGSEVPRAPFLTNPTNCQAGPQTVTMTFESWQRPGQTSVATSPQPPIEDCDSLPFEPAIEVVPDTTQAAAPVGLDVRVRLPQVEGAESQATASLRKAVVTLPRGVAVSPSAASGQQGCDDAQFGLHRLGRAACPDASKIGTVALETPLLNAPMRGSVWLGTPIGSDPQSGTMLRIFTQLEGSGVSVKLLGSIVADPVTGQLTTTFSENPALPFESLTLSMAGGPGAPLSNPRSCGAAVTTSTMTSYGGQVRDPSDAYTVTGCGPVEFSPSLLAGAANPLAGAYSPFSFSLVREDPEEELRTIENVRLPQGLLAKVASVPLCGDADAARGTCPDASRVGSVQIAAGVGPSPLWVPQPGKRPTAVYLTGPYKGAPYGLSIAIPAQAGPFDLGVVVVRSALRVNPSTAQISTGIDESRLYAPDGSLEQTIPGGMPTILKGIPLGLREIQIVVDRQDFMLNPTNCSERQVAADAIGAVGTRARIANRFQLGDCAALGFKPRLSLRLFGPTHRNAHPRLRAEVRPRRGDANISGAVVTLPRSELLENAHIRTICTRVQYAAGACPKGSIYGRAKAWSPLLDSPLQGPVYLRSSDNLLPDLVVALDGQVKVDLVGRIDAHKARIRTSFETVPDVPVSRFVLSMQGGKKGLLANNRELCGRTHRAEVQFSGQNGRVRQSQPVVEASCGGKRQTAGAGTARDDIRPGRVSFRK